MRRSGIDHTLLKKLSAAVMAIALLLFAAALLIPGARLTASAESLYIRKIVSVVYDDSGSMLGEKNAYANYAMQAFCGMLNAEDTLYITYMNASKDSSAEDGFRAEKVDLSAGGIQNSIDAIRRHGANGGTPFESVESAYNLLKREQDADNNPNTQYWLVVITDGSFSGQSKEDLDRKFTEYAEGTMPNGTHPQITFLGIDSAIAPDEDENRGIYTYTAQNAAGITDAMNDMADRISGRTRLSSDSIRQVSSDTIEVSSIIPLLNIVLFTQGTDAAVTSASYSGGSTLPIVRSASLRSSEGLSGDPLVGGTFLVGDSRQTIGSGSYRITFSGPVSLDEIVVLFEPALEMRMTIGINGREITDLSVLDDTVKGDKLSVSCKVYERGTDTVIAPDLLPPGTLFEIAVYENGTLAGQVTDSGMQLSDFELDAVETQIRASVTIEGFRPIEVSASFQPLEEPRIAYTVSESFGGGSSVHIDDIGSGALSIRFTVYADGVPVTDPDVVRSLSPVITAAPEGCTGTVSYADDGTIVYEPTQAAAPDGAVDSFGVEVTCTLINGASASETFTVFLVKYEIFPTDAVGQVKKTGFYQNDTGVSFYVTRDGVRLDKAAIENEIAVSLNKAHSSLLLNTSVSADGTVTVVPYSDEEHVVNFGSWWGNWVYYFLLSGSDVVVTLDTPYGSADAVIDVVGESAPYQLLNVYLPLLVELAIAVFLAVWIFLIVQKPRFPKGAKLYKFTVRWNGDSKTISGGACEELDAYNWVWSCGRWKFKRELDAVSGGIPFCAARGGEIEYRGGGTLYRINRIRVSNVNSLSGVTENDKKAVNMYIHCSGSGKLTATFNDPAYRQGNTAPAAGRGRRENGLRPCLKAKLFYILLDENSFRNTHQGAVIENGTLYIWTVERKEEKNKNKFGGK